MQLGVCSCINVINLYCISSTYFSCQPFSSYLTLFLFCSDPPISSPVIRTLDLCTSSQAPVATKFNDRLKAIERAASSSATSAASESSPSSSSSTKPVGKQTKLMEYFTFSYHYFLLCTRTTCVLSDISYLFLF